MKPIEPGCKALVVKAQNPDNIGKCVDVVRRVKAKEWIPEAEAYTPYTGWVAVGDIVTVSGHVGIASFPDGWLIRIDGYDKEDDLETEDELVKEEG